MLNAFKPASTRIERNLWTKRSMCRASPGTSAIPSLELSYHRIKAATTWFDWHNDALARINEIRCSEASDPRRVKIAILDSGIELSQDTKELYDPEHTIRYKSWVDESTEWKDEVGHGTHLAVLLRKIAPNAIVHVARVFRKKPTKSSVTNIAKVNLKKRFTVFTAYSDQALEHAVNEWKVDIIVLSLGFGEKHKELSDAIVHAASKRVLIFAAASNDGKNRSDGIAWPAANHNVICVHSADGLGTRSSFTPSPRDSKRIMVLGECVKSAWPPHLNSAGDHKLMSGTSCAAPIAAGIAALVLDYARGFLSEQEWEDFRETTSMLRMFEKIRDEHSTDGYWWIKHWQWFDWNKDEGYIKGEIRSCI
jgi:hypothetical protein